MAIFPIPSLSDLVQRLRAAFRAELPGTDAWLWPNNVGPTAKVFGGGLQELFGRLAFVAKQAFVLTAEGQWLDMWGSQYGLPRKAAGPATGAVTVTAPDAIDVPAGTIFARSDGFQYASSADASLTAAGTLNVAATALTAGSAGNAIAGTPLTFGATVTGAGASLATAVVASNGIAQGADVEPDGDPSTSDLATYRGRILFRLRNPPQGGAPADYVTWALSVAGVTRLYVERRWRGPGTVRIFPIFDDLFAATGGIASADAIESVDAALQEMAPATAMVATVAPVPQPIDVMIANLDPLTLDMQNAIELELAAAIRRNGRVAGCDSTLTSMTFLATPFSFSRSWIDQAISNTVGQNRHILVAPSADIPVPAGAIPVLGSIGYTTAP